LINTNYPPLEYPVHYNTEYREYYTSTTNTPTNSDHSGALLDPVEESLRQTNKSLDLWCAENKLNELYYTKFYGNMGENKKIVFGSHILPK